MRARPMLNWGKPSFPGWAVHHATGRAVTPWRHLARQGTQASIAPLPLQHRLLHRRHRYSGPCGRASESQARLLARAFVALARHQGRGTTPESRGLSASRMRSGLLPVSMTPRQGATWTRWSCIRRRRQFRSAFNLEAVELEGARPRPTAKGHRHRGNLPHTYHCQHECKQRVRQPHQRASVIHRRVQ